MALRMHPVPATVWAKLAAARRPIDLVEEAATDSAPDKGHRIRSEHARIQAHLDALAPRRESASH